MVVDGLIAWIHTARDMHARAPVVVLTKEDGA